MANNDISAFKFKLPLAIKALLDKKQYSGGADPKNIKVSITDNSITVQISDPQADIEAIKKLLGTIGEVSIDHNTITINPNAFKAEQLVTSYVEAENLLKKLDLVKGHLKLGFVNTFDVVDPQTNKILKTIPLLRVSHNDKSLGKFIIDMSYEPQVDGELSKGDKVAQRETIGMQMYAKLVDGKYIDGEIKDKKIRKTINGTANEDRDRFDFTITVDASNPDGISNLNAILDKELLESSKSKFVGLLTKLKVRPFELELQSEKNGAYPYASFAIVGDEDRGTRICEMLAKLTGLQMQDLKRTDKTVAGSLPVVRCLFMKAGKSLSI